MRNDVGWFMSLSVTFVKRPVDRRLGTNPPWKTFLRSGPGYKWTVLTGNILKRGRPFILFWEWMRDHDLGLDGSCIMDATSHHPLRPGTSDDLLG